MKKVHGVLTEEEHLELATLAIKNRSTQEAIASLALREIIKKLKRGGVRLPRDRRIAENRNRHNKEK